ncbi:MAG: hypothetical protein MUO62_04685, partial [Anaerolineales bacterium]|nr:hypothetical protein [Anaerolineales bacterium]
MQRTWLRQGDKRRENPSLDRVKAALGAKTPSPLNNPLGVCLSKLCCFFANQVLGFVSFKVEIKNEYKQK